MDITVLKTTLSQMLVMLFFVAVGWFFGRIGFFPKDFGKGLSKIQVNLFMPLMVLNSLSSTMTLENATQKGSLILYSIPILLYSILFANILARVLSKDKIRRNMFIYAFAFTNCGYLGYPVIRAVFGEEMLSNFIIFYLPFTFALYSYGQSLFEKDGNVSLWKKLVKPVTVALVVGSALGLSGLRLPSAVSTAFSVGADCVGPNAMLMTGIALSGCSLKKLVLKPFSYFISLLKLVFCPALIFGILYILGVRGVTLLCGVTVAAMPIGMNVIVFPQANGLDVTEGAGHCLIANTLSVITVPLIFSLLSALM